jgi:glycosyltransferase involved in cell wall biosynthesis
MRIVHIITRLIIGGAQENTLLSCEGQHDRGHDVTLITGPAIGPEGSLIDRAARYGYRFELIDEMRRAIRPMRDWAVARRLVRRLRELQPDIVHTHSSKAGIIGRWAANKAGASAVIHTVHGLAFTASTSGLANGVYKMLERWAAPMTTKIVCVADAMRGQSLAAGVGRPEQYVTVYSGMETEPFIDPTVSREETRRRLGFSDDQIVVGTIARLFELKGHDDLLDEAPRLCREIPQLRFLWVGDGLLRGEFERRMTMLGLRDRFALTGMVPPADVPIYTSAMDILAHPSRREGLARALPQASLAGIPTITYDVDGNREGTLDGLTGFVLPAFEKTKFADAIVTLAKDPDKRREMGIAGRSFALRRFDSKVMLDALETVYADALKLARMPGNEGSRGYGVAR